MIFGPYTDRQLAKSFGATHYLGSACKHNHLAPRFTSTGRCSQCASVQGAEWSKGKSDIFAGYSRAWRRRNPELVKFLNMLRHRDTWPLVRIARLAKAAERHAKNPEPMRARARNRRGREKGAVGYATLEEMRQLFVSQDGLCAYCYSSAEHLDHMISLFNGGSNWPENLQWLCAFHNLSKGRMNDNEYRAKFMQPATGKFRCVS